MRESGVEFDLSKPCGKVSVVSCIAVDQGGCRTKSQCRDEAIRVGPPGSGSVHTLRPLTGITPQPSVGLCGDAHLDGCSQELGSK